MTWPPLTTQFESQDVIILPTKISDVTLVRNHSRPTSPSTLPNLKKLRLDIAQTTPSVTSRKDLAITSMLAHPNSPETAEAQSNAHVESTTQSISSSGIFPESTEGRPGNDVVMGDATSTTLSLSRLPHKPQNDEDLPPWLASMITYLRGVAKEAGWQDLVTVFVEFEKCGPPNGVSSPSHSWSILDETQVVNVVCRTCLQSAVYRRSRVGSRAKRRTLYLW